METKFKQLKSINVRYSGRSSDYLFPTIVQGCTGRCTYCYAARHSENFRRELLISHNIDEILDKVSNYNCDINKPNQTHSKYITWDIGCNSDVSVDMNYYNYEKIFNYFKYSSRDLGTFATKFTNHKLLEYNPNRKIRVRLSLMPDRISRIVEPNTSSISNRIRFINKLYEAGYEVHLNFSPVIYYKGWLDDYRKLFKQINSSITTAVAEELKCEIIFLTHNESLHSRNMSNQILGENIIWVPELQESKISSFGGKNVRYKRSLKSTLVSEFKQVLREELPYCKIRYIF